MGFASFAATAGLLLVAACGGSEFAAGGGGEGGTSGGTGGASAGTDGPSGSAGVTIVGTGVGGSAGGVVDASATGGSGGQPAGDASHPRDVSGGSGGMTTVDARADVGPPDTGPVPSCPTVEPTLLGSCSGALKCTYGTHPRIACRKTYTCSAGQWSLAPPTMCGDLQICQPPYPQVGFSCTNTGSDCIWDSGLYCRCLACPDMGCPRWDCFPPPNGCATTPPNLGQRCDATTTQPACEFGECSLGTRVTVTCVNGFINWTFPNCQ
jgi:hypothetical protein